jgi:two-component system, cell cycle sensor histidine kinase and response regulator CckA
MTETFKGLSDVPNDDCYREKEISLSTEDINKYILTPYKGIEQLNQIQKLGAIGRVAGSIAHDFNNILTIIAGYTDVLLLSIAENTPSQEDLLSIKRVIEYGRTLTKQLLTFSNRQPIQSEVMELNGLINNFESHLYRLIGKNIQLVLSLQAKNTLVKVASGQVEQILMNLVVNARDAMPQGGKLTIETKNVLLDQEYVIQYPEVQVGEYIMLAVTDTGVGMNKETLSHIFEPYYTTKGENGTGLGLATVYGIVKQQNGHVRVYSELGTGTTFKVYLPLEKQAVIPQLEPAELAPAPAPNILVVEDDPIVRPIIAKILHRHGYNTQEAQSGEEALEFCRRANCSFDLVITDITLPGMNGVQFAEQLKLICPDMRFIFSSGYTELATNDRHLLPPDAEFIEKPFSPSQLIAKIKKLTT